MKSVYILVIRLILIEILRRQSLGWYIYIYIYIYITWVKACALCEISIKINVMIEQDSCKNCQDVICVLSRAWVWSDCGRLALSVSWTHGLVPQSVGTSERNSVVVGSNPNQVDFLWLLVRIFQWWTPCVSNLSTTFVWLSWWNFDWDNVATGEGST